MAHALVSSNPSLACFSRSGLRRKDALPHQLIASSSSAPRLPVVRAMPSSDTNGASLSKAASSKGWKSSAVGPVVSSGAQFQMANIPVWARWALGSLVIVAVPLYNRMFRIGGNIEKAVEEVIEVVENVAEVTEKIASDVADALPEGASLKKKALLIEQIAHNVDKDAKIAEAIMHEVDHIKEEVDTLVKPTIEKGDQMEKEVPMEEPKESTDQTKAN